MIDTDSNRMFAKDPEGFVLDQPVRRLNVSDVFTKFELTVEEEATQDDRDQLAKALRRIRSYLKQFAHVPSDGGNFASDGQPCLGCGERLAGMLGTFRYGIRHGEGHCAKCGYPSRRDHYIRDDDGELLLELHLIFQYHPDLVKKEDQG